MPDRHVALIGMMGAGKTTVGKLLAAQLDRRFLDSDVEIESEAGMSVAEIFRRHGEDAFRDWEAKAVCEAVLQPEPVIVGVAGGAVLREETRTVLRKNSVVVWLRAPIEVLIERVIVRSADRPMIADDPEKSMRSLYEERRGIYENLASLTVDASSDSPEQIAKVIAENVR